MAKTYTHPHWETNVIDRSIYQALVRETLPLFRPIFFARTQSGPVGIPVWVSSYTDAVAQYGEGTFDMDTPYFSRESLYMSQLFARQGCFVVRMADSEAKAASMVLELQVKKVDVPQYERDAYGQYKLDENDERIPLTDSGTGAHITEPGVELKWTTRALKLDGDHPETITNLKPRTYGQGSNGEYVVYPILAATASSVGAYGNDLGLKLFVNLETLDETLIQNLKALTYSFGIVKKTYGQDTVSPVYNDFGDQFAEFVCREGAKDTRIDRLMYFDDIVDNVFRDTPLPFKMHLYSQNVLEASKAVMEVEDDDDTLVDPLMVNLTDTYNAESVPMPHVTFSTDDDSIVLTDSRILYLQGGNDGDLSDDTMEKLQTQYLKDLVYPELLDQPRYPFTHLIDTGVTIATKKAMIQFMGKHDAHKVVLATQDAHMNMNTKAQDMSINIGPCGLAA